MAELFSKSQYNRHIRALRKRFPWVKEAVIRPAPGHLEAVRGFLSDMEEIFGAGVLEKNLAFLRIIADEENDLLTSFDIDLSEATKESMRVARRVAFQLARQRCATCGEVIDVSSSRVCDAHAFTPPLSFKGGASIAATQTPAPAPTAQEAPPAVAQPDIRSDVQPDSASRTDTPCVQLFADMEVDVLAQSAENRDSDARKRIQAVVKRLRATTALRPLATLMPDWQAVLTGLAEDFPNCAEVIDFIHDQCALQAMGDGRLALPPMLLDGPPGVGKTELSLRLATLFDTASLVINMSAAQSNSALSGSEAFWGNSREGHLFELLAFSRTANPVVILDELDKISADGRFAPEGPLYQLLEPRTAADFHDLSLPELTLDASHILWIATCNDTSRISEPLLSRFNVFKVQPPSAEQSQQIARSIYARLMEANAWGARLAGQLDDEAVALLAGYSPRQMRVLLQRACGRAARVGRNAVQASDIAAPRAAASPGIGFVRAQP